MELKTKYQYTYFIYPYIIDENNYTNYMYKLLKNKKCKLKIFEQEKYPGMYNYFLPRIQEYMFWTFDLRKNRIKELQSMNIRTKSAILSKYHCNIFEYELTKDMQAKVGEKNGIFFDIEKIELVCFNSGICFLLLKTILPQVSSFSDVLNFNYKFREINSENNHLKDYENIKLQTGKFKDTKDLTEFIKEIAGNNIEAKKINVQTDKFITYSYTCIDQSTWNEETVAKEFAKYVNIYPESKQDTDKRIDKSIELDKFTRCGFSNSSMVLLTTDVNIENYTKILYKFENEYLYTYILNLYKKIYLKNINYELSKKKKFELVKNKFIDFASDIWIEEVTNDDYGQIIDKKTKEALKTEETFIKLKSKYDVLYKDYNLEKTTRSSKYILRITFLLLIINIIILVFFYN